MNDCQMEWTPTNLLVSKNDMNKAVNKKNDSVGYQTPKRNVEIF